MKKRYGLCVILLLFAVGMAACKDNNKTEEKSSTVEESKIYMQEDIHPVLGGYKEVKNSAYDITSLFATYPEANILMEYEVMFVNDEPGYVRIVPFSVKDQKIYEEKSVRAECDINNSVIVGGDNGIAIFDKESSDCSYILYDVTYNTMRKMKLSETVSGIKVVGRQGKKTLIYDNGIIKKFDILDGVCESIADFNILSDGINKYKFSDISAVAMVSGQLMVYGIGERNSEKSEAVHARIDMSGNVFRWGKDPESDITMFDNGICRTLYDIEKGDRVYLTPNDNSELLIVGSDDKVKLLAPVVVSASGKSAGYVYIKDNVLNVEIKKIKGEAYMLSRTLALPDFSKDTDVGFVYMDDENQIMYVEFLRENARNIYALDYVEKKQENGDSGKFEGYEEVSDGVYELSDIFDFSSYIDVYIYFPQEVLLGVLDNEHAVFIPFDIEEGKVYEELAVKVPYMSSVFGQNSYIYRTDSDIYVFYEKENVMSNTYYHYDVNRHVVEEKTTGDSMRDKNWRIVGKGLNNTFLVACESRILQFAPDTGITKLCFDLQDKEEIFSTITKIVQTDKGYAFLGQKNSNSKYSDICFGILNSSQKVVCYDKYSPDKGSVNGTAYENGMVVIADDKNKERPNTKLRIFDIEDMSERNITIPDNKAVCNISESGRYIYYSVYDESKNITLEKIVDASNGNVIKQFEMPQREKKVLVAPIYLDEKARTLYVRTNYYDIYALKF